MKYFFNQKRLAILAGCMAVVTLSCEKEEVVTDHELPSVALTVSGNPEKLYNEITISATATDNEAVKQVVFFLNSDSIGADAEAPFELLWNTREAEDNKYVLKAVAFDASGNKAEAGREVTINNTLFKVNVGEGYMEVLSSGDETTDIWMYLSDKEGKVIGDPKQFVSGTSLVWIRPANYDSDTIYVNEVNYNKWAWSDIDYSYEFYQLYTYTEVTSKDMSFSITANSGPDSVGRAEIIINNNFDGSKWYNYSTEISRNTVQAGTASGSLDYGITMREEQEQALTTYEYSDGEPEVRERYFRIDELSAGNTYEFHTDDFKPMEEYYVSFPFSFDNASINVTGYLDETMTDAYSIDYTDSKWDGLINSNTLKAFYIKDPFTYTKTTISVNSGNKRTYQSKTNSPLPSSYNLPAFSMELKGTDMKDIEVLSTSGSFDLAAISWSFTEDSDKKQEFVSRQIYLGNHTAAYTLPEIPAEILEIYPKFGEEASYSHNFTYLLDNAALGSYKEILDYWFSGNSDIPNYSDYTSLYIYPENAGGRIGSAISAEEMKKEIEKENLRARGMIVN